MYVYIHIYIYRDKIVMFLNHQPFTNWWQEFPLEMARKPASYQRQSLSGMNVHLPANTLWSFHVAIENGTFGSLIYLFKLEKEISSLC